MSNVISDELADSFLRKDPTLVYKLEFFKTHIETDPSKQQAAPKLRLSFNRRSPKDFKRREGVLPSKQ